MTSLYTFKIYDILNRIANSEDNKDGQHVSKTNLGSSALDCLASVGQPPER